MGPINATNLTGISMQTFRGAPLTNGGLANFSFRRTLTASFVDHNVHPVGETNLFKGWLTLHVIYPNGGGGCLVMRKKLLRINLINTHQAHIFKYCAQTVSQS